MVQTTEKPATGTKHTDRIERLYAHLWEGILKKKEWWGQGLTVLDDPAVAASPLIVRKAKAIEKVLTGMPVDIGEGELLVGIIRMGSLGMGYVFPQYAHPDEEAAAADKSLSIYSVYGHSVAQYDKLLGVGLRGIKAEAEAGLQSLATEGEDREGKRAFLRAVIISCDAVIALAHRYSALATELAARETNVRRRAELERVAEICAHVPENPARSFAEALQSFWFLFIAFHSTMTSAPVGRFDYYLGPYLQRDLDSGAITREQAQELVDCLWIKFNERTQLLEEHREYHKEGSREGVGRDPDDVQIRTDLDNAYDNHYLQNMILSGQTEDGQDTTNELTYLCLEATGHFQLTQPTVSVRLSPNAPEALLRKACEVMRGGGGMPALFNDNVIVAGLHQLGLPLEVARVYSHDGCWETLIPGRTDFRWGPVHGLKCVEYVLTRGLGRVSQRQEGVDTGDPTTLSTFEDFMAAYQTQLDHQVRHFISNFVKYWDARAEIAPEPLLSGLIEGCLEQATDLTAGGARYIFYAPVISGLAHTADSLAAIKKLVYEEKRLTMAEMLEVLAADFDGQETVRQLLLTRVPKYGNGVAYVDGLARQVAHEFYLSVRKCASQHPQFWFPTGTGAIGGLYMTFGQMIGATPDGRHFREAISSGFTPGAGREMEGPTAAVKSYTTVDFVELPTGGPLDLDMDPNAIRGEAGLRRLMAFARAFLEMGGSVLTITVTDVDTLRRAQTRPDQYRGLRVRMGGWQAYFVALNREHQEQHIARSKHSLR